MLSCTLPYSPRCRVPVLGLASGDLHLEDIRRWRETSVAAPLGLPLACPLWASPPRSNYDALMADLDASGVPCSVCAVADPRAECSIGALFGTALRVSLEAAGLDGFGEAGEIHTLAEVWKTDPDIALGLPLAAPVASSLSPSW